jgi:hypothetical protein
MIKQLSQKSLFLLILLFVLLQGSICANGPDVHNNDAPWKFAVISDTQGGNQGKTDNSSINEPIIRAIAGDIAVEHPDFVLVAGDLVSGWFRNRGTEFIAQYASWKEAMRSVYDAGIEVYPIRGNHDVGPERVVLPPLPAHLEPPATAAALQEEAFKSILSEPYMPGNGPRGEQEFTFSFFHKNAFIVGLDVCGNRQHKVDQGWLDKEFELLKKSRDIRRIPDMEWDISRHDDRGVHVFVYAHEPAFEVRHRDCLAFYRKERDAFWDALGSVGSRIYFCGHDHLYNRAVIADSAGNKIRQIVAGTGGGRLVQWSGAYKENTRVKREYSNSGHHGYVLVTIDGPRATVVWKALVMLEKETEWRVLDSFSYTLPHAAEAHGYGK